MDILKSSQTASTIPNRGKFLAGVSAGTQGDFKFMDESLKEGCTIGGRALIGVYPEDMEEEARSFDRIPESIIRIIKGLNHHELSRANPVFDEGRNTLKLLKLTRDLFAIDCPKRAEELVRILRGIGPENEVEIDPKDVRVLLTSSSLRLFGPTLTACGLNDFLLAEPYVLLGSAFWDQKSQFLTNSLSTHLSIPIMRLMLNSIFGQLGMKIARDMKLKYNLPYEPMSCNELSKRYGNDVKIMASPQFVGNAPNVYGYPYEEGWQRYENLSLEERYNLLGPDGLGGFMRRAKERGDKILIVTLGSMEISEEARQYLINEIRSVLDIGGISIVFLGTPEGENSGKENEFYWPRYVSYALIFPLANFLLTHGGSGTAHSALRSKGLFDQGLSVYTLRFLADQDSWTNGLNEIGILMGTSSYRNPFGRMAFQGQMLKKAIQSITPEHIENSRNASERESRYHSHGTENLAQLLAQPAESR